MQEREREMKKRSKKESASTHHFYSGKTFLRQGQTQGCKEGRMRGSRTNPNHSERDSTLGVGCKVEACDPCQNRLSNDRPFRWPVGNGGDSGRYQTVEGCRVGQADACVWFSGGWVKYWDCGIHRRHQIWRRGRGHYGGGGCWGACLKNEIWHPLMMTSWGDVTTGQLILTCYTCTGYRPICCELGHALQCWYLQPPEG